MLYKKKKINEKMMNSKKTEFIMCLVFRVWIWMNDEV